jgi:trigger factor
MDLKTKVVDSANAKVEAKITKDILEDKENKIAKTAAKDMKVDGFRKGKVPVHVVKARYGDKLKEDAKNEAVREVYEKALKELKLDSSTIIGEPQVTKFEEKDGEIALEISIATRPKIDLKGYKDLIPDIKAPKVTKKEEEERLKALLEGVAKLQPIKKKRALKEGDFALIDFEGFKDGEPFQGGKAEGYTLEIGSGAFIPGFEEQLIGMKEGETKEIEVTFPQNYQSSDLAGKDVTFKVTLHEIQEKVIPDDIDDETLKQLLPQAENPTEKMLKEEIKLQLENEKLTKYYQDEVKPKFVEALIKKYEIDLPENIVRQEIDMALNNALSQMKEDEAKKLVEDKKALEKKREELKEDAQNSVKLTFIVDELAKQEKITVDDQEVMQVLYYEALQSGQNPQEVLSYYENQGLLPAVKMAIIEDRLFAKLFNEKKDAKKPSKAKKEEKK